MLYTLQILLFHATLKKEIHVLQKSAHTFKGVFMKKNLQTAFITRQHMLSRDFELYYYNDHNLSKVDLHSHNYYEFYFFHFVLTYFFPLVLLISQKTNLY